MDPAQNQTLQLGYKSLTKKECLKGNNENNFHLLQNDCPPSYINTGSDVSESVKYFVLEDVPLRK